jgi:hypothetical protein
MSLKNKKYILIFIICTSIIAKAYPGDTAAFNKSNRYRISVSAGPAIPFFNFGSPGSASSKNQYDSSYNGYAKTGFHLAINAEYFLSPHAAVKASFGWNTNSFNTTAYNNSIFYNEPGMASVSANSYNSWEYMVGFFLTTPFKSYPSKVSLNFSVMGGCFSSNFPTIVTTFSQTATQQAGISTLTANSAQGLMGNIGFGIQYKINGHLFASMEVSFTLTYLEFTSALYTETIQGNQPISTTPGNPPDVWVGLIKPAIGVGYIF